MLKLQVVFPLGWITFVVQHQTHLLRVVATMELELKIVATAKTLLYRVFNVGEIAWVHDCDKTAKVSYLYILAL